MSTVQNSFPGHLPILLPDGQINPQWFQFFYNLYSTVGAPISTDLDEITTAPGAMLYRGASIWSGLPLGASGTVLIAGTSPGWGLLTSAQFQPAAANLLLAGPASGPSATPSFRALATADLNSTAGQYPGAATNSNASAGNIGEYAAGSGTVASLTTGVAADLATLSLSAGDWDVGGSLTCSPGAGATPTVRRAWINTVSATDPGAPNGGAYLLNQDTVGAALQSVAPVGMMRLSLAVTTTAYLSCSIAFAGGSLGASGFIAARRAR